MALHNLDLGDEKNARPIRSNKRKDKKLWIEQGKYVFNIFTVVYTFFNPVGFTIVYYGIYV